MKKLPTTKVMRDPIHSYIHVDYEVIWQLINAKEFQRLRRIQQLGGTFTVFHTAEHSRIGHSLGVYEITRRMISEIIGLKDQLNEFEQISVLCAALLHDIGHGPFSHAFESIVKTNHEAMTIQILLNDSEVHNILLAADKNLPQTVASIIDHSHSNKILVQLVSSQLDADRMDYLLRDSYFTGTTYGEFDLERVLRTLLVVDNQLVVKETGVHTIEDYIMARYHMYWQVYYHPTARSFEAILILLFRRLKDLKQANKYPMFNSILATNKMTNSEHYDLDEDACYYGFSLMSKDKDAILSDLANRLLTRKLFSYQTINGNENIADYQYLIGDLDYRYYLFIDSAQQVPYQPYLVGQENLINVLSKEHHIVELSTVSNIVKAIVGGEYKEDSKLYYCGQYNH